MKKLRIKQSNFTIAKNAKLEEHIQCHEERSRENVQQTLECNKCDKVYGNISKLRRHDWISHREVDCTVCGERLESRQNISQHRKDKHQMFKIAKCKFFPQCIDADECFFTHDNVPNEGETNRFSRNAYFCKDGENCEDQSCPISESNHMKSKAVLCRFQANCNRISCSFKHTCERKAFLGVASSNLKEK